MLERHPSRRVNHRVGDFYNKDSYRAAVLRAIAKANRQLPMNQQIPKWTPYELRHSAASAISVELGGDAAQLQCGHTSHTTTAIYLHREVEKLTKLAVQRESHNPFVENTENSSCQSVNFETGERLPVVVDLETLEAGAGLPFVLYHDLHKPLCTIEKITKTQSELKAEGAFTRGAWSF